jgi:hypothetical protein
MVAGFCGKGKWRKETAKHAKYAKEIAKSIMSRILRHLSALLISSLASFNR